MMRLLDDPLKNVERWKKLTYMKDYQDPGTPKPGATVLAEMKTPQRKMPLLITQNYGRGRTALMATSGTWRWQMSEALGDPAHDLFWQQLLRWLVADSPGRVVAATSAETLTDDGQVRLTASVRGQEYMPAADAKVEAHVIGPEGMAALVEMRPTAMFRGTMWWIGRRRRRGAYLAEVTARVAGPRGRVRRRRMLSRDVVAFQRTDGVAENFHTEQNREMLEKLSDGDGREVLEDG